MTLTLDTEERTVEVPPALADALAGDAAASVAWERLAFTHRKEFARWIEEAKRDETRSRRVQQALRDAADRQDPQLAGASDPKLQPLGQDLPAPPAQVKATVAAEPLLLVVLDQARRVRPAVDSQDRGPARSRYLGRGLEQSCPDPVTGVLARAQQQDYVQLGLHGSGHVGGRGPDRQRADDLALVLGDLDLVLAQRPMHQSPHLGAVGEGLLAPLADQAAADKPLHGLVEQGEGCRLVV